MFIKSIWLYEIELAQTQDVAVPLSVMVHETDQLKIQNSFFKIAISFSIVENRYTYYVKYGTY